MLIAPIPHSGSAVILLGLALTRDSFKKDVRNILANFTETPFSSLTWLRSYGSDISIGIHPLYTSWEGPAAFYLKNKKLHLDFKILFVRNPLVRLLSAYYGQEGKTVQRNGTTVKSFNEFINGIIESTSDDGLGYATSWYTYQHVEPCRVQWDFIGKKHPR